MKSQLNIQDELHKTLLKIPGQVITFAQVTLVIILLVSFPLLYTVIKNGKFNFSRASLSNGVATVRVTPESGNLTPNITQSLPLLFNTNGEYVDGIQLVLNFTGDVPGDLQFTPAIVSGLTPIITTVETNPDQSKIASIVFITSNPKNPFSTGNTEIQLGNFSFTNNSSGQLHVAFDQQLSTSLRTGTVDDILKNPTDQNYDFSLSANSGRLFFNALTPVNPQQLNSTFQVEVAADSGTQTLSGVDAQVTFDPSMIEITSIQKSVKTSFVSYPELKYDNVAGKIYISANIGTSATPTLVKGSVLPIAQISARIKKASASTTLEFAYTPNDRNDSNLVASLNPDGSEPMDILGQVENQTITVSGPTITGSLSPSPSPTAIITIVPGFSITPTPTDSPLPSNTVTPVPTVTLGAPITNTVQVGLQGKNRDTADKSAQLQITLKSLESGTTLKPQSVQTDPNGFATVSILPGNYEMLIKTPGYLPKVIGSTTEPIVVDPSNPNIDLRLKPLLGGDFNADGEVNEIDYTLHLLTSFRKSDPVVDLDSSGVVNNLDFSIMRGNWGLTGDNL